MKPKADRIAWVHMGAKRKLCGKAGSKAAASVLPDEITCPECIELSLGFLEFKKEAEHVR